RLTRLAELREALDRVDDRVGERALNRTLRKLIVPEVVTLTYKSRASTNQNTLQRVSDNQFTGTFGELKETVSFTVRGEDYITGRATARGGEPPGEDRRESGGERPPPPPPPPEEGRGGELRGGPQASQALPPSVPGDPPNRDAPAGTHLTPTATTNKPLE